MRTGFRIVSYFQKLRVIPLYKCSSLQQKKEVKQSPSEVINQPQKPSSFKKAFDLTPDVKFQEREDLLSEDITQSPTHFKFSKQQESNSEETSTSLQGFYTSQNGLMINQQSELQLKDNPLALKVLSEGKIDLRDERISVTTLDSSEKALLGGLDGLHSISLGKIDVLPKNGVLLEDIDVNNIPEDKDIIIDKNTKILYAIGKKVQNKKRYSTTVNESDDKIESTQESTFEQKENKKDQQKNKYELQMSKKIFEELSLEEYKGKYLSSVEKEFVTFDFVMLLRQLIGAIPILLLSGFFFESSVELYKCKRDLLLMEDQLLEPFLQIRRNQQRDILLNDPSFDRTMLFGKGTH